MKDNLSYSILLIEDNPGDFLLISDYLEEHIVNPKIEKAITFEKAKKILTNSINNFDVVLLDISLPDINVTDLIEEILILCNQVPIIALTGYSDIEFSINSISKGIADYLLKDELNAELLYKSILYSIERQNKQNELLESEKRYSNLFHSSPLPMWVFDLDTLEFLDVNKAAQKHYGYSEEEFLSMKLTIIRPEEDLKHFFAQIDKLKLNDITYSNGIYRHIKKNGEVICVEIQSKKLAFKKRNARVVLINDITDRLEYISTIETKNQELQEIAWLQSHVIRAPVAKIMGIIELMKQIPLSTEEKDLLLSDLMSCAEELDKVIHDIANKTHAARLK